MLDQETREQEIQTALETVARLNTYVATGHSLDRLGRICAVPEDIVQEMMAGTVLYENHRQTAVAYPFREPLARIREYLDTLAALDDDAAYAITPTFQRVQNLIAQAHQGNIIVAITGAWGIGKSQAARYYAAIHPRRYNQPGAVHVPLNETENSPRQVLGKILHHLGVPAGKQSQRSMMQTVLGIFRPGDHLILDECQKIKEALEVLSALHDEAGIGITLIGNPAFSHAVWGESDDFPALASRAHRFDFPANTEQDVDAWLAWHGFPAGLDTRQRAAFEREAIRIGTSGKSWGGLRALSHAARMFKTTYSGTVLTAENLSGFIAMTKKGSLTPRKPA